MLVQIQSSNFDAVGVLISKYERLLRTIIRNEVGYDAADDVFSETCLAVVKRFRRKGAADIENVEKWLKRVARSKCKEYYRNVQKQSDIIEIATRQYTATIEQELHRALRQGKVVEVIEEMEPIYRDVAELLLQGWTFAEISEKLDIPEGTAKSRKRKIIDKLCEHFGVSPPHKKSK